MEARESTVRAAEGYAEEGYLCSEAVLLALAESMGVESELIPRIATGFAAGVARTGNLCGALSGAVMGLGLRYGRDAPETEPGRRPYWDYRRYSEENMWATKCREVIKTAARLAWDLIQEEK